MHWTDNKRSRRGSFDVRGTFVWYFMHFEVSRHRVFARAFSSCITRNSRPCDAEGLLLLLKCSSPSPIGTQFLTLANLLLSLSLSLSYSVFLSLVSTLERICRRIYISIASIGALQSASFCLPWTFRTFWTSFCWSSTHISSRMVTSPQSKII